MHQPPPGPPRGARMPAFVAPQLALATFGLPVVIYLPPFFAGPMGLGLSATGLIFMVTRFWDVFTDPLLGWLTDRFPTRWGRRKIWMAVSTPLMMLGVVMLCFPPENVTPVYLGLWLFFLYIWWTLIHICHLAWAAELSDDYDVRSRIQSRLLAAYFIGLLLVLSAPLVVAQFAGETSLRQNVQAMGIFALIVLPLATLCVLWSAREPPPAIRPASEPRSKMDWRRALALILANPPLLRVAMTDLFAGMGAGISTALFVFFARDVLALSGNPVVFGVVLDPSILLLVNFTGALIGVPLWLRLSYRIGKHNAVAASAVLGCVALLGLLLIPPGSFGLAMIYYLASGLSFAAPPFLDRAILSDVVDLDESRTGEKRTAIFFSLVSMTNKIGYALPLGFLFPMLDLVGYQTEGTNTPGAIAALTAMFIGLPILCNLVMIACMWRFPIDRTRQQALKAQLQTELAAPTSGN